MKIVSALYQDFAHFDHRYKGAELIVASNRSDIKFNKDDVLILHGGSDINPAIYGEECHSKTQAINYQRDLAEIALAKQAFEGGALVYGICRGAQLLCALNGGKLKQHIHGHVGWGNHDIIDIESGSVMNTTSCHHQMMLPTEDATILAITPTPIDFSNTIEPEVVTWKKTKSFAVQGHPEWMQENSPFVQYLFRKVEELWQ